MNGECSSHVTDEKPHKIQVGKYEWVDWKHVVCMHLAQDRN